MVAAFYFLILTGQMLETREQIFTLSAVISVFLSPVQWEQGTAQLLGCCSGSGHPTGVTQIWSGQLGKLQCQSCDVATRARL